MTTELTPVEQAVADALRSEFYDSIGVYEYDDAARVAVAAAFAADPTVADDAEPSGCAVCGIGQREHCQRYATGAGWHVWKAPTSEQRKGRMLGRRSGR